MGRSRPQVGDTMILFGEWAAKIRTVTPNTVDIGVKPIPLRMLARGPEPGMWLLVDGKVDGQVPEDTPLTVAEVTKLTGLSRQVVTDLFKKEPGVIVTPGSKKRRSLRIPRRVYERVIRRYTVQ